MTGPDPKTLPDGDIADDRFRLIFTCCHPALPPETRVALALRTLLGLTTPEIARAFLVPELTVAQRLSGPRRQSGPPGSPTWCRRPASCRSGSAVSWRCCTCCSTRATAHPPAPHPVRPELSAEAIRLTRLLLALLPGESETVGLLALNGRPNDSRRGARTDASGDPAPLPEQDRTRWDRDAIDEGLHLLAAATHPAEQPGPYLLQAEIAACHASAACPADTDWAAIPGCMRSSPFCCPPRWLNSTAPSL